jgi:N-acetylglutamate synthase-like GNAT family acetyltransferase/2-polyprenyl-3-methyl-5-hydroxy-6-metoxy-1,4-benzoquinol methylase
MGVDCCHANQDKFWVEDPDGVEWEVYHLNYDLPAGGIQAQVKEKYGAAALRVRQEDGSACCGAGPSPTAGNPVTSNLYTAAETAALPAEAVQASLGCGNPVALAQLTPGDVVLDLGSGGGIDVLLSARRVGPTGKAYGLDMTDEMLALARENQAKAGVENVDFLRGEIEAIPLPEASVDVIISNCVINLSADKPRVFAEAYRVLKPGGRLAVSDIVVRGPVPEPIRKSVEAWTGCIAGTLEEDEYAALLAAAGFEAVTIEPTRIYRAEDARPFLEGLRAAIERQGIRFDDLLAEADGKFRSAFIRAVKPAGAVTAELDDAAPADLEPVVALLTEAGLPTAGVAEHFADFAVARADGRVIGAIGLERYGAAGLLRSLVVARALRGQGYGRALTERLVETARRRGVRSLFLLTETAAPFFAAAGFRRVPREEAAPAVGASIEFTTVCCHSAACMRRDL